MSDVGALYVIPKQAGKARALASTHGWGEVWDCKFYLDFLPSGWQDIILIMMVSLWFEYKALRKQQLIKAPGEEDKHCNPHL